MTRIMALFIVQHITPLNAEGKPQQVHLSSMNDIIFRRELLVKPLEYWNRARKHSILQQRVSSGLYSLQLYRLKQEIL